VSQIVEPKSYSSIFRAASIMGGASGVVMLLGFIKTKSAAIIVGTDGVGLLASFTAIQTLASTITNLGLGVSSIRSLATNGNENNKVELASTVCAVRRLSCLTGAIGMLMIIVLSKNINRATFGQNNHIVEICLLGLIVFLSNLSITYLATLQALRKVSELAQINIYTALASTVITVICYKIFSLNGIVLALMLSGLFQYIIVRRFTGGVNIGCVNQKWSESIRRSKSLVGLGFTLMWSTLLINLSVYVILRILNHDFGIRESGLFSAAYTISAASVSFVLGAMASDYYPRLVIVCNQTQSLTRLVNEQTEVALLLSLPGLFVGIVFAPGILSLLYSEDFIPAAVAMQILTFGCLGRVVAFPMCYVMLATGKSWSYFLTESLFNIILMLGAFIGAKNYGINGVACAVCIAYVVYCVWLYTFCRRTISLKWSSSCQRILFVCTCSCVTAKIISNNTEALSLGLIGGIGSLLIVTYSLLCVMRRVGVDNKFLSSAYLIPGFKKLKNIFM
jgi:antigen flippase